MNHKKKASDFTKLWKPHELELLLQRATEETARELAKELKRNTPDELMKGFKYVSAGDEKVCKRCAALHGMVFPMSDKSHRPPLHPHCRCWIIPVSLDPITMKTNVKGAEVEFKHEEVSKVEYGTVKKEATGFIRKTIENMKAKYIKEVLSILKEVLAFD